MSRAVPGEYPFCVRTPAPECAITIPRRAAPFVEYRHPRAGPGTLSTQRFRTGEQHPLERAQWNSSCGDSHPCGEIRISHLNSETETVRRPTNRLGSCGRHQAHSIFLGHNTIKQRIESPRLHGRRPPISLQPLGRSTVPRPTLTPSCSLFETDTARHSITAPTPAFRAHSSRTILHRRHRAPSSSASLLIPLKRAAVVANVGRHAARPVAGIHLFLVLLHPRQPPEHNVFARWRALDAPVEAVLGHGIVSVNVGQRKGPGDRRRPCARYVLSLRFHTNSSSRFYSTKSPARAKSEDLLAIKEELRAGKGCAIPGLPHCVAHPESHGIRRGNICFTLSCA